MAKNTVKTKLSQWKVVGLVVVGLLILLAVGWAINKSQDIGSDARKKEEKVVCNKNTEITQVNRKGNVVCVAKPKTEINGKTGCKNGEKEYRDNNGKAVCLAKCKPGYIVGTDRETGKFGCMKPVEEKITCALNSRLVTDNKGNSVCKCKPGYMTNSRNLCTEIVTCSQNQNRIETDRGFECQCKPGFMKKGTRCIEIVLY